VEPVVVSARGRIELGLPPSELWGVAMTDRRKGFDPKSPRRGEAARARRAAKRKAKAMGITLKA